MTIVLNPTTSLAASTTALVDMVPDISAFLPGCPSLVIQRTIHKIITDACQRAKIWTYDLNAIPLTIGDYSYALVSPLAYAEPTDVLSAHVVVDDVKRTLQQVNYDTLLRISPYWPEDYSGTPMYMTTTRPGDLMLAPVPDAVGLLYVRAALRPTADAAEWDQTLYNEYRRLIFHGVLHELMMMPERSWSNEKSAMAHGKQWTYLLGSAKDRAAKGYNSDTLTVDMRPFA